ncbi:3-deoxy-D-manno-octulosonate 8-phosphate phosphatas KdsC [Mycobacteroides abscessus subsp. abscessus]|nr:3-deoxy-D-manno-octulosonate 8-phosphate phosphatas KdsC [Mycobacteroides abscessus subsp. abscessus]
MTKIKLFVFDVDGVLTDGRLYISSNGEEIKAFHTQDGMGISLAHYTGIKTAIITGRKSEAVTKRAHELKINYVFQGIHEKLAILENIVQELGINMNEVCYIGDDINDLPILRMVGYPAAPFNAVAPVKEEVKYISLKNGGEGAVREIIDTVLAQQHDYSSLMEDYLSGKVRVVQ